MVLFVLGSFSTSRVIVDLSSWRNMWKIFGDGGVVELFGFCLAVYGFLVGLKFCGLIM